MIAAIVQARMGSTRLPSKIMKNLAGKILLERVLERLERVKKIDSIIIATTNKKEDDVIEKFCKEKRMKCFRGSEEDVLNRIYEAAEFFGADVILRVTADDPLIDPENIDEMIASHIKNNADLTYTEGMPLGTGLGMCVISFGALKKANNEAKKQRHREHTDEYILENKDNFRINILQAKPELRANFRLTVDTEEDFKLMKRIYKELEKEGFVNLKNVIKLLNKKPELVKINQRIKQK